MNLRATIRNTAIGRIATYLFVAPLLYVVPAPAVYAQQVTAIEEVTVTAQKREESLQDVPLSVTALSADELELLGVRSLRDLVDGVIPALKVSPYPNSPATLNLSMRGTNAADAGSTFTELPVGVYIDGIYLGRAQGAGVDIVDVERLEVLRGPQGTLYGRNNVGGAVNFVTAKPSGEFRFRQVASGGTEWGAWDSITRVDLPQWNWLGGAFKTRFSYLRSEDDGWLENSFGRGRFDSNYWAQSKEAWRVALRWEWSDVTLDYAHDQSRNEIGQAYFQVNFGDPVEGFGPTANVGPLAAACPLGTRENPMNPLLTFDGTGAVTGVNTACTDQIELIGDLTTPIPALAAAGGERLDEVGGGAYGVPVQPTAVDTLGHAITVTWDVYDNLQIKFISSYREVDQLTNTSYAGAFGRGVTNAPQRGVIDQEQFSQEFQFLGSAVDGKLDYVAGLYYYSEDVYERSGQINTAFLTSNPSHAGLNLPTYSATYPLLGLSAGLFGAAQASVDGTIPGVPLPVQGAIVGVLETLGTLAAIPYYDANGAPVVLDTPQLFIGMDNGDGIYDFEQELSVEVESVALYAQFEYDLSETLDFIFGVRYSDDTRDAVRHFDLRRLAQPTCHRQSLPLPPTLEGCSLVREVDSDSTDYNLVLNYRVTDEVDVYWRYATGYKAAGIDRRSLSLITFGDETLDSLEWGVKSNFADNRVRWNAAYFTSNYRDKQNTFNDPTPGAQVTDTLTRNAEGVVEIDGFESELTIVPVSGLRLGINYTYLDWTYPRQPHICSPQPAAGTECGAPGTEDLIIDNGLRVLQSAPRHSGSFVLDYTFPRFAFGDLSLHMDWTSSTGFFYSPRHFDRIDARDVINARVVLDAIPLDFRGNLKLTLWGTNLTDEEYVTYSITQPHPTIQGGAVVSDAYGQPRTAGLEISYEY